MYLKNLPLLKEGGKKHAFLFYFHLKIRVYQAMLKIVLIKYFLSIRLNPTKKEITMNNIIKHKINNARLI